VRAAIQARGAGLRYLTPYAPDLNPIEQVFAKLKAFARAKPPRGPDELWDTIGAGLTVSHTPNAPTISPTQAVHG